MTAQTSQSTQTEQAISGLVTNEKFKTELLEIFMDNAILTRMRRARKKKEFIGILKYGSRYNRTDDPGPF